MFENTAMIGVILSLVGIGISSVAVMYAIEIRAEEKEIRHVLTDDKQKKLESFQISLLREIENLSDSLGGFENQLVEMGHIYDSDEKMIKLFFESLKNQYRSLWTHYLTRNYLLNESTIEDYTQFQSIWNNLEMMFNYTIEKKGFRKHMLSSFSRTLRHSMPKKFKHFKFLETRNISERDEIIQELKEDYDKSK